MQKKEKREYIFYLLWGVEFALGSGICSGEWNLLWGEKLLWGVEFALWGCNVALGREVALGRQCCSILLWRSKCCSRILLWGVEVALGREFALGMQCYSGDAMLLWGVEFALGSGSRSGEKVTRKELINATFINSYFCSLNFLWLDNFIGRLEIFRAFVCIR